MNKFRRGEKNAFFNLAIWWWAISSCVCAVTTHIDTVLAQEYNALDNADVYEQCTDLACQAASVQVLQMLSQGEQQQKQPATHLQSAASSAGSAGVSIAHRQGA
mgnify:CR=1 FL=1